MDISTISQLVSSIGFPIVCCVVLFYQNSKFSDTLGELTTTLKGMEDRLSCIERKLEGDEK